VDEADAGVAALGENLSEAALKMAPMKKLGFYFPSGVEDESIHIVVQAPSYKSLAGHSHSLKSLIPFSMQYHQRVKGSVCLMMIPTATPCESECRRDAVLTSSG
jgi:hypothetical protein